MKIRFSTAALLIMALGTASIPAKAALVYDNGPLNGNIDGWIIHVGSVVSDSFAVSSPTSLTSAEVGLWVLYPGATPYIIDWAIGTSPFGSEISSGTASITSNTAAGISTGHAEGYPMFISTFAINGTLTAGTYYFTLQNGLAENQFYSDYGLAWDANNGPSIAYQFSAEQIDPSEPLDTSHTFKLYGESADSVPDASATIALLGGALAGVALMRRRLTS